jgi:hypothetical protein
VAIQWTLDLLLSRQIEQFLTLKDLEQIELLAAQVQMARPDAKSPKQARAVEPGPVESSEPIASAESSPSHPSAEIYGRANPPLGSRTCVSTVARII